MLEVSFAAVMLMQVIIGRVTLLNQRSRHPIQRPLNAANAVLDVVAAVAGLAIWANIVWGFSALNWFEALPIIVVTAIIGGILPNPPRFEFFFRLERFMEFGIVALTCWLWVWNWPY